MKKPLRNILANFLSKTWGFLALYLFSRIYINILGIEQYGVISFYTLVFGVVSFIDAGFSASLNREFAREGVDSYLYRLLLFFERLYFLICLLAGVLIFFFAPYISEQWLKVENGSIPLANLSNYVKLIGIGVSIQLFSSIYFGALMGRQIQVWANGAQLACSMAKTLGAVGVLYLFNKSLYSFFIWQVLCYVAYLLALRWKILKSLSVPVKPNVARIKDIPAVLWNYLGGMTLIAILSALAIQSDKVIASKLFTLTNFGFYSLASMLAQFPVLIITPVALAMFPVFVKHFTSARFNALYKLYQDLSFLVCILIYPLCAILCLYGNAIFNFWISKKNAATAPEGIGLAIALLTLGNTFQALRFIPFYLLLAKGNTRFIVWLCLFELIFIVPALFYFVENFGLAGIGIPWLIVKSLGYVFILIFVDRLKKQIHQTEYLKVIILPAISTSVVAVLIFLVFRYWLDYQGFIVPSIFIALISTVLNIFFYDKRFFNVLKIKSLLAVDRLDRKNRK